MFFKFLALMGALAALVWMLRTILGDLRDLAAEAARAFPVAANVAMLLTIVPVMMLADEARARFAKRA